jgi:flagellin-like hook-associated protein FlgL
VGHPGTSDAFQSLIDLRDQLRNGNHLSTHDQIAAISGQIGELEHVHDNVLKTLGQQSASLQSLDSLETHLQDVQTSARKTVSELGDASVTDIVVKLQAYQQMLQLSLETFARINGVSLLDFLK